MLDSPCNKYDVQTTINNEKCESYQLPNINLVENPCNCLSYHCSNAVSPPFAQVDGKTTIQFDDSSVKTIGFVDSLFCRFGWVHHGDVKYSVKATVLSLDSCGDSGLILCDNLNSLCSPHVMHVYACVEGTNETYLALQYFDKTFSSFIEDEKSLMIVNNGRFANAFIEVSGCVSFFYFIFTCSNLSTYNVFVFVGI